MRVIVCGGHAFGRVPAGPPVASFKPEIERASRERAFLNETLDGLHAEHEFTELHVGRDGGVERLAWQWGQRVGVGGVRYDADWRHKGVQAGLDRNDRMLDAARADLLIVFPGGEVTQDMIAKATARGLHVVQVMDVTLNVPPSPSRQVATRS